MSQLSLPQTNGLWTAPSHSAEWKKLREPSRSAPFQTNVWSNCWVASNSSSGWVIFSWMTFCWAGKLFHILPHLSLTNELVLRWTLQQRWLKTEISSPFWPQPLAYRAKSCVILVPKHLHVETCPLVMNAGVFRGSQQAETRGKSFMLTCFKLCSACQPSSLCVCDTFSGWTPRDARSVTRSEDGQSPRCSSELTEITLGGLLWEQLQSKKKGYWLSWNPLWSSFAEDVAEENVSGQKGNGEVFVKPFRLLGSLLWVHPPAQ